MPRTGWLALGALAAALASQAPWSPGLGRTGLVAVGIAAALAAAARGTRTMALLLGAAAITLRLLVGDAGAQPRADPPATSLDGHWVGEVASLGSTAGGQQRAVLVVRAADPAMAVGGAGPWRAYAWLPRYPTFVPGDRVVFDGRLEMVRHDGSEFAAYLDGIGAVVTTRVREARLLGEGGGIVGLAESMRAAADIGLARVLPEPMAGLASAILVGRRDRVAREVSDAFTTTGLSHVVAISGWNIALIGAVIGGALTAAGISRRARTVIIVIALAGFTLVAGGGASVVRAALMGGVALVARESGRPGSAAASLGLAVWMLLMLDPAMATDIGFQLSAAATAGLLAWGSRLTAHMAGRSPGRGRLWLAGSLGVSLAAQAATLPLVLLHFGRLSLVAPVANLIVAPIVAPAMLVGAVCLVVGLVVGMGVPAVLAAPFAVLGWVVLGAMVAVANALATLPFASLELPAAAGGGAALAVGTITAAVAWRHRNGPSHRSVAGSDPPPPVPVATTSTRRSEPTAAVSAPPAVRPWSAASPRRPALVLAAATGTMTLLVGAGVLIAFGHREPRLVVTALDVGQGDAILVDGPRGGRLLLDGGPDPDRLMSVLDRHVPAWDRRIDLVILTHPHEDHVAGLTVLLSRYRVAAIAENGMLGAGPGDAAFRGWLAATGVTTRRLAAGDRVDLDGIPALVRWPIRGEVPERSPSEGRRVNDTSVVLDLTFGERRLMLTGDIEDDVDPRLLATGIGQPGRRLDVLKVAHHGSGTATSEPWLDALRPRVALVSAGLGNPYGHPAPRTIERLEDHGARVLRTDLDGDLEVSTDGHDLRIATSGGRPRTAIASTASASGWPARRPTAGLAGGAGTTPIVVRSFLCAIPLTAARLAAAVPSRAPHAPIGRPVVPSGPPIGGPHAPARGDPLLACYDRSDDDPFPAGCGRPSAVVPAHRRDPRALDGGRGCGLVPGGRTDPRGPPGGPRAGRGSRAPA
jgi:competence protein ComEC